MEWMRGIKERGKPRKSLGFGMINGISNGAIFWKLERLGTGVELKHSFHQSLRVLTTDGLFYQWQPSSPLVIDLSRPRPHPLLYRMTD